MFSSPVLVEVGLMPLRVVQFVQPVPSHSTDSIIRLEVRMVNFYNFNYLRKWLIMIFQEITGENMKNDGQGIK